MHQLRSRGEFMGGPPSETINEKTPLILPIGSGHVFFENTGNARYGEVALNALKKLRATQDL
jgi:hypothetical protein